MPHFYTSLEESKAPVGVNADCKLNTTPSLSLYHFSYWRGAVFSIFLMVTTGFQFA